MSIAIPYSVITDEIKEYIEETCIINTTPSQYHPDSREIICYDVDSNNNIIVPMDTAISMGVLPSKKHKTFKFTTTIVPLTAKTDAKKRDQDVVIKEVMQNLNKYRSCFVAVFTGGGKTKLATYTSVQYGLKICIICYLMEVRKQWKAEFEQNTNLKVQMVNTKKLDPTAHVYIIGVKKATTFSPEDFKDIGFLIWDESHMNTEKVASDVFLRFRPQYLLGLSATPDRPDGLEILFDPYFGPIERYVIRKETKPFTVIKYKTRYKPTIEYTRCKGERVLNWGIVKKSLELNSDRQNEIINLMVYEFEKFEEDERLMVLCFFNEHCDSICEKLDERNLKYDRLYAGHTDTKEHAILVAGIKKAGVGWNEPRLKVLYMATDVKDIRQNEGRLRTIGCTIYDIVDNFSTLEKHWGLREEWFLEKGAVIIVKNSPTVATATKSKK
jgi:hypothetical protein